MNVRGAGNAKQRNLIVSVQMMKGKDSKPDYGMLDVQADQRDPVTKGLKDGNPHAASNEFKTPDGQTRVAHGRAYTGEQVKKIMEASQFIEVDGKMVGTVKADLMFVKGKDGKPGRDLIINTTKPIGPSDFKVGPKTLQNQAKATKDIRAKNQAERAAAKEVQAEAEAEAELE